MAIDTTTLRTRRAILMGALGGVAASVAAAVGRASPVSATDGDPVLVGHSYSATTTTWISATGIGAFRGSSDSWPGVYGDSTSWTGVYGNSNSGDGVGGHSASGYGISGGSTSASGIYGNSAARNHAAILGQSYGASTGVQGYSGTGSPPAVPAKTGVFGYANQGASAAGVRGISSKGRGGTFKGGIAQLRLVPSTATTHPHSGAAGDLFLDKNKRLWFCKGGTTWHQIA